MAKILVGLAILFSATCAMELLNKARYDTSGHVLCVKWLFLGLFADAVALAIMGGGWWAFLLVPVGIVCSTLILIFVLPRIGEPVTSAAMFLCIIVLPCIATRWSGYLWIPAGIILGSMTAFVVIMNRASASAASPAVGRPRS